MKSYPGSPVLLRRCENSPKTGLPCQPAIFPEKCLLPLACSLSAHAEQALYSQCRAER